MIALTKLHQIEVYPAALGVVPSVDEIFVPYDRRVCGDDVTGEAERGIADFCERHHLTGGHLEALLYGDTTDLTDAERELQRSLRKLIERAIGGSVTR